MREGKRENNGHQTTETHAEAACSLAKHFTVILQNREPTRSVPLRYTELARVT